MKKVFVSLVLGLGMSSAFAAELKVVTCSGSTSDRNPTAVVRVDATLVSGAPLAGGVIEIQQSNPRAHFRLLGYYVNLSHDEEANFTASNSDGFELSIPAIQLMDLPAGTNRGYLRLSKDSESISVRCKQ